MSHIILISPDRSQIETHEVDTELFCKVWDLVHEVKKSQMSEGMSFGAASSLVAVRDAMANSEPAEITELEEIEPVMEMGTQFIPEPKPAPKDDNAAFAASLAALFN